MTKEHNLYFIKFDTFVSEDIVEKITEWVIILANQIFERRVIQRT